jgi:RimJ/RimL family protein N-acetyltransferase
MPDATPPPTNRAEPIIGHGSVYLRPAERTDVPRFVAWLTDARTTRTLATIAPMSLALEERWFDSLVERQGNDLWHFVICRSADDRPVGGIDLHAIDSVNGTAGLGIVIGDPSDTDQGYGTDAMRAIVRFGFGRLRLERIWLDVDADNDRARHVYERVGFVVEGVLRHAIFREGSHHDLVRMSLLRAEWAAARADGT